MGGCVRALMASAAFLDSAGKRYSQRKGTGKKFTALFTDLANPTSNSIYQRIGYRPICNFDCYQFSAAKS